MKRTSQLPTTLAGEKHFIVEGLTDDVITLAANSLAAVTDMADDAVGHPTESKDRVQERDDTLTPELMAHVTQITSSPEQYVQKIARKLTDWTVRQRLPDTPTVTLKCH